MNVQIHYTKKYLTMSMPKTLYSHVIKKSMRNENHENTRFKIIDSMNDRESQ